MSGLLIAVGLVVLITLHEIGHFLAAKAFGLYVPEFGLGFPPKLWGKKIGETEYTVNALPIGGFVRIAGEDDGSPDLGDAVPRERLLSAQPPWKRAVVVAAGVAVNAIIAWVLLAAVLMIGTPHVVVVTGVDASSPAATAGLQANDIVADYASADAFASAARELIGQDFSFAVRRGGDLVQVTAQPRTPDEEHPGALGVSLTEGGVDRVPFWRAPYDALLSTWDLVKATLGGFGSLIASLFHGSVPSDVVGPVGIVSTAGQVGAVGAIYLVQMLAVISINLAVLNLLPLPALDGGRLYLTLVEWATGRKVPQWLEIRMNAVAFIALVGLLLLLTARDVFRLF